MPDTLILPGQHPILSFAELLTLTGLSPDAIQTATPDGFIFAGTLTPAQFPRLGGTIKAGQVVAELDTLDKENVLLRIAAYLRTEPAEKLRFGLSFVGPNSRSWDPEEMAFLVKSAVEDKSIRYVLPKEHGQTSAAQILHQKLLPPDGYDLTVFLTHDKAWLARTSHIQDIESYRLRDEGRPFRIRSEGMMPLKLCQIMINLATPNRTETRPTLLDPFCGSGTILQEALLADYDVIGSDLSPDAVKHSEANLAWFKKYMLKDDAAEWSLFTQDVRQIGRALLPNSIDLIVSEGYLGELFTKPPTRELIAMQNKKLAPLYLAAFREFHRILRPGGKIAITLPYYLQENISLAEQILDAVLTIGYTSSSLLPEGAARALGTDSLHRIRPRGTYIYARPDQLIGREILLLQK